MAEKDLVYYKQWIPAWHQMDKYSANPWCLFSKNVDIFSSSNSYKATAFSTPSSQWSDIVDMDERWRIVLKSNCDVVDTLNDTVLFNAATEFTAIWANPKVDYVWPESSSHFDTAVFWTPQKLVVKYDWDEWSEIVVFSDRTMFVKPRYTKRIDYTDQASWTWVYWKDCTATFTSTWAIRITDMTKKNFSVYVNFKTPWFCKAKMYVEWHLSGSSTWTVEWSATDPVRYCPPLCNYDAPSDSMIQRTWGTTISITPPELWQEYNYINFETPMYTVTHDDYAWNCVLLFFKLNTNDTVNTSSPRKWVIELDTPSNITEYYNLLPLTENRDIKNIWEYYYIYNGWTFPSLRTYESEWVTRRKTIEWVERIVDVPLYTFTQFMWWEIDPAMKAVDCVSFNEKVYLICNKDWNWYIFPCSLSWEKWTPYIAYWVEFKAAIVLNYLIYLVWENRWVSTLFIYSWTELVHVIEWNQKNWYWDDKVNKSEQFKFNWMMADWRGKLVLGTEDNRVFCYWQTFWGRWWSFIHSLAEWQVLESIRTIGKDLYIKYTETETSWGVETTVLKTIKYQDDTAIKNYNTEFEVVYPVVIGNHIIEKEVYDLYCSYRLPSVSTKLEFWLSVNHNYFWSFLTDWTVTPTAWDKFKISSCSWEYWLVFVEKVWNWLTFTLDGDLPYQTLNTANLVSEDTETTIPFIEYNNFKRIRQITTDSFKEWFYREENITAKLWLPRVHSVQLMVRWIGTANYTPEVFWVSLDSNQRNRW